MKKDTWFVNCNVFETEMGTNIGRIFSVSKIPKSIIIPEQNIDLLKVPKDAPLNISIPTIME